MAIEPRTFLELNAKYQIVPGSGDAISYYDDGTMLFGEALSVLEQFTDLNQQAIYDPIHAAIHMLQMASAAFAASHAEHRKVKS
ncbi:MULTISPECIES: hypothetical protein [Hydrocarboniphaga]|uniref:Uncharacterized protein n=1 Tax=Hydrocarboniphaga effusa AP103 TaxID=1172194 RepID=I8T7S0_9GAMM|nr:MULTISPECIES: hypothetical protein [Hydrocarboniphaga]EIT69975.1 hypothetical protein WQQ_01120 [Hydrocarboniphaga effusa AP103]EIT70162.1 hypothetical protein WQQ_02990 [Hydrocarboniphaga effusa AP103]MDZ4077209.1 hypothetical protein [Hydrocarboniphaga sp.]